MVNRIISMLPRVLSFDVSAEHSHNDSSERLDPAERARQSVEKMREVWRRWQATERARHAAERMQAAYRQWASRPAQLPVPPAPHVRPPSGAPPSPPIAVVAPPPAPAAGHPPAPPAVVVQPPPLPPAPAACVLPNDPACGVVVNTPSATPPPPPISSTSPSGGRRAELNTLIGNKVRNVVSQNLNGPIELVRSNYPSISIFRVLVRASGSIHRASDGWQLGELEISNVEVSYEGWNPTSSDAGIIETAVNRALKQRGIICDLSNLTPEQQRAVFAPDRPGAGLLVTFGARPFEVQINFRYELRTEPPQ